MLKIQKVLYPTDFSDRARQALPHAVRLARAVGARLDILHVLQLPEAEEGSSRVAGEEEPARRGLENAAGAAARRWEEAAEGLSAEASPQVVQVLRRGIAARVVAEYAAEEDVDIIVLGSHGRRGIRRMLLGSVAAETIRSASCPVLVVKEQATEAAEFRRVLVPLDYSEHSAAALAHARGIASLYGARVRLLHVVPQLVYPEFYFRVADMTVNIPTLMKASRERLEALAERMAEAAPGVETDVEVRAGRAGLEILDAAASFEADLVVMGSHGLSGVARIFLGSVTEQVIRGARSSVLVVRSHGKQLVPTPSPEEETLHKRSS